MKCWTCGICQYVYDPQEGDQLNDIQPGTPFEELPDSWICPICGASKDNFSED
jgi:rubredoxin